MASAADESAPKRGRGRPKGSKATETQKAALDAGRAKRAAIRAARAEAKKSGDVPAKSRHQMLIDGELDVRELDEQELRRFRGRDIDGEFKGRTAPLPTQIHSKIRQRLLQTMQEGFEGFLPRAQAILEDIAEAGDTDSARVKAVDLLLQRGAGKVPDIVRVGAEDPWDAILSDVLREDGIESAEFNRLKQGLKDLAERGPTEEV